MGVTLTGSQIGQWDGRTPVPVVVFLANQQGWGVGGAGKGGKSSQHSRAPVGLGRGREKNTVKIRVGGRFNHSSVPIGLFLKGDAPLSKERSLGPEGGDQRRLKRRQLHLDWVRVGVAWGKALHFTFFSSPRGRHRDARRLAAPARAGDQVAGPRSAAFLMEAGGEVGQDGWQAAPLGPGLITDTRPRRSPRLKPKTLRSGSGSSGNAARLVPPRARLLSCAPPSLAHPPPLARASGSQTPRAARGGRKAVAARRREVIGRCFAAPAVKGGRRSKLGEAAGAPGGRGAGVRWSARNRLPGPALSLFSFALSAHCWRW